MPPRPFATAKGPAAAPSTAKLDSSVVSTPVGGATSSKAEFPPAEAGFPDPYKLLGDSRKVVVLKEITQKARLINCIMGVCGVTRYRYYVRDAVTGRDYFKCKLSYSSSSSLCSPGTRHHYTLDIYCVPIDGSNVLGNDSKKGLFLSTSSSETSPVSTGGHGVMDMRNMETLGRVIPGPTGAITIKNTSQGIAFRIAAPINAGYGGVSSEMLVEDGATTALVGRIVKNWSKSDTDWSLCCCCLNSSEPHGNFLLDMTAVSNVKKRALLVAAAIVADATAFSFRAAPPAILSNEYKNSSEKKPLLREGSA